MNRKAFAFALLIGLAACALFQITWGVQPQGHSDFSVVWNGARIFLAGGNPYAAIGPGRELAFYYYELHYPASTLVAIAPFTLLSERSADFVFVFTSAFLLAYGATRENWNRVWLFPSSAFVIAARTGQWTPLIASAYFLPWMAAVVCLKPSNGLPVLIVQKRRAVIAASIVTAVLLAIAFAIDPGWPRRWLSTVSGSWEFVSPVARLGGFLLLLALLRWRQREARFLFVLSLVPAVSSWYEALLPMLVARTKRETQFLSLTSSIGYLLLIPLALSSPTSEVSTFTVGRMMIAFCYLPALLVVLRRSDD